MDNDYRELVENARDALRELLDRSEPHSLMAVRTVYGHLHAALARNTKSVDVESTSTSDDHAWEVYRDQRKMWRRMPREARENVLLDALGDEALIISELTTRMNSEVRKRQGWDTTVLDNGGELSLIYAGETRSIAVRLLETGELERDERRRGKRMVQHFSRKRGLDGRIAQLDEAFHEGEAG